MYSVSVIPTIVGGVVGGVIGLAIVIIFGLYILLKKPPRSSSGEEESAPPTVEYNERAQVQPRTRNEVYNSYAEYPNEEKVNDPRLANAQIVYTRWRLTVFMINRQ